MNSMASSSVRIPTRIASAILLCGNPMSSNVVYNLVSLFFQLARVFQSILHQSTLPQRHSCLQSYLRIPLHLIRSSLSSTIIPLDFHFLSVTKSKLNLTEITESKLNRVIIYVAVSFPTNCVQTLSLNLYSYTPSFIATTDLSPNLKDSYSLSKSFSNNSWHRRTGITSPYL